MSSNCLVFHASGGISSSPAAFLLSLIVLTMVNQNRNAIVSTLLLNKSLFLLGLPCYQFFFIYCRITLHYLLIYIYVCVCVCVCVRERERERESFIWISFSVNSRVHLCGYLRKLYTRVCTVKPVWSTCATILSLPGFNNMYQLSIGSSSSAGGRNQRWNVYDDRCRLSNTNNTYGAAM